MKQKCHWVCFASAKFTWAWIMTFSKAAVSSLLHWRKLIFPLLPGTNCTWRYQLYLERGVPTVESFLIWRETAMSILSSQFWDPVWRELVQVLSVLPQSLWVHMYISLLRLEDTVSLELSIIVVPDNLSTSFYIYIMKKIPLKKECFKVSITQHIVELFLCWLPSTSRRCFSNEGWERQQEVNLY